MVDHVIFGFGRSTADITLVHCRTIHGNLAVLKKSENFSSNRCNIGISCSDNSEKNKNSSNYDIFYRQKFRQSKIVFNLGKVLPKLNLRQNEKNVKLRGISSNEILAKRQKKPVK